MPLLLAFGPLHWLFIIPISLLSIFLTLLILVQRGRGGGLTGALGGMGGQSAFGTKAGDVFTKITVVTALLWIVLSMAALRVLHVGKLEKSPNGTTPVKGTETPDDKGTDDKGATAPTAETPAAKPDDKGATPETKAPEATKGETPATPALPDAPKNDTPPAKSEAPAPEAPKADAPKADEPKTEEEKK